MSDLERRLTEGLAGVADRLPHPGDLSAGARDRLRRRRRTTGGVVAAALAVVAVPVAASLVGLGPDREGATDPAAEVPTAEPESGGVRTETWRDLSVEVPRSWGWGGGSDWCTSGRSVDATTPQVSRPGGVVPTIACSPATGYGAHFLAPSADLIPLGAEGTATLHSSDGYPEGAWLGFVSTQQAKVAVVAADRATAQEVLDSATPVGEVDANGCATRAEMTSASTREQLSVCRYSRDGWLEQSEVLSPADSDAAIDAVRAAPPASERQRSCVDQGSGSIVLLVDSIGFGVNLDCGIVWESDVSRQLTEDVLYWALSPGWSGSYPEGVPVPEELRTQ